MMPVTAASMELLPGARCSARLFIHVIVPNAHKTIIIPLLQMRKPRLPKVR
jgi:hypothetical protein